MIGKLMGKTEVEREKREAWLERSMSKTELKKKKEVKRRELGRVRSRKCFSHTVQYMMNEDIKTKGFLYKE